MTDDQHNKYVGWLFLGYAAFQLLMTLVMVAMFSMFLFVPMQPGQPDLPAAFFFMFIGFMLVFQILFTAPSVIAAYGVLKRKTWARTASIIASVLAAMSVPVGTAACVYALWFFLGDNWKSIYEPTTEVGQLPPPPSRWEPYQQNERGVYVYNNVEPPDWR